MPPVEVEVVWLPDGAGQPAQVGAGVWHVAEVCAWVQVVELCVDVVELCADKAAANKTVTNRMRTKRTENCVVIQSPPYRKSYRWGRVHLKCRTRKPRICHI